jgi:hypothetical protein
MSKRGAAACAAGAFGRVGHLHDSPTLGGVASIRKIAETVGIEFPVLCEFYDLRDGEIGRRVINTDRATPMGLRARITTPLSDRLN